MLVLLCLVTIIAIQCSEDIPWHTALRALLELIGDNTGPANEYGQQTSERPTSSKDFIPHTCLTDKKRLLIIYSPSPYMYACDQKQRVDMQSVTRSEKDVMGRPDILYVSCLPPIRTSPGDMPSRCMLLIRPSGDMALNSDYVYVNYGIETFPRITSVIFSWKQHTLRFLSFQTAIQLPPTPSLRALCQIRDEEEINIEKRLTSVHPPLSEDLQSNNSAHCSKDYDDAVLESPQKQAKDNANSHKNEDNSSYTTVYNVDSCYSWIVLLSCSMVVLISQIPITISGILYLEFVESFPGKQSVVLWGSSLAASLTYILGPLAAVFVEQTSARTAAMVGCAGLGLSLFALAFTTNIALFFFLYGLLSSLFGALTYIPAVTFSVHHFDKYQQTALILGSVSAAAAYLVIPPIVAEILKYHTWREATLFAASLCIQGTVLAALMKPVQIKELTSSPVISSISSDKLSDCTQVTSKQARCLVVDNDMDDASPTSQNDKRATCKSRLLDAWSPLFHWRMIALIASSIVYGWNAGIYFVRVPFHVEKFGLTPEATAQIYMIGAISSICVRLSGALIGRCVKYDNAVVTCVGALFGAACMTGFSVSTDYNSFAVCCTLYGISHAILASLATPLILEVHGEHRVELVFGLEMMFFGISVLISPPIAQAVDFALASNFIGFAVSIAVSVAGAVTFLPHFIIKFKRTDASYDISE